MKIQQPFSMTPGIGAAKAGQNEKKTAGTGESFGDTLTNAIKDVNSLQQNAGTAVQQMVGGENVDLHEVMIAVEKAKTSFDLLMEVRNKTVEAYRELMRMQV